MIRKSKWIEIHSASEPVARAARRTLDARLRLVWHYLPLAADWNSEDQEHVHQLRVATRRAITALDIFAALLPPRKTRWFRKQLKRVRKAAGEARDFDVLSARLAKLAEADPHRADVWESVLETIDECRRAAQEPVKDVHVRLRDKHYKERVRKLIRKLDDTDAELGSVPFGTVAVSRMRNLVDDFFAAAGEDLRQIDLVHRLRVRGKHLRYGMEVFAGAFRAEFRGELYPLIEALQEQLGELNDRANARARFEQWSRNLSKPEDRTLLEELAQQEQQALSRLHEQFLDWWTEQRATDLRRRFETELASATLGA